jgi:histidine ammonia-lyase
MKKFNFGINQMSIEDIFAILNGDLAISLNDEAIEKINKSRESVENIVAQEKVVYGINTGFGSLCNNTNYHI